MGKKPEISDWAISITALILMYAFVGWGAYELYNGNFLLFLLFGGSGIAISFAHWYGHWIPKNMCRRYRRG